MRQLLVALSTIILLLYAVPNEALDPSQCIAPLGMENGAIKDEDITASSSFDSSNVGPHHGRVRTDRNGGAWCPSEQATTEPEEWIQIDLKSVHMITATGTQGRFGNGVGIEYAEAYILEYWRSRLSKWIRYHNSKGEEVLTANINTYLESKRDLDPPVWASKIRFYPYSYHTRTVCMRVELYGCRWTDGIVSYSTPQGDKRGANWDFYDNGYDGHWEGDELRHGLGQLIDGKFGHDDFKTDFYNENQRWVGWKNDTRQNKPIEIKFEFDKVREFSAVHIFCNNQFTKDVQVFSHAKIMFSVGGKRFKGEPITYEYVEDRIFENARNISIKLHHRVGKFVKIHLTFAAKWMLVSEITFDSVVAHGNFTLESEPTTVSSVKNKNHTGDRHSEHKIEIPVPNGTDWKIVLAVIAVAVLVTISLITVYLIYRCRNRKLFRSPNSSNIGFSGGGLPHLQPESVYGMSEKDGSIAAYGVTEIDEYRRSHGTLKSSLKSTLPLPHPHMAENNEYQEPYQALKYAPYYSYSPVVMEMEDVMPDSIKKYPMQQIDAYDYAIPEPGTLPLLGYDNTLPMTRTRVSSASSKSNRASSRNSHSEGKKSPTQKEALMALKRRLEDTQLIEFPRHRLRMLSKLSEGAFGTVYIAEADGIAEYNSSVTLGTRLVAIKFLGGKSSDKEKKDIYRDVRILAAFDDPNMSRVLGICSQEEPICLVMEYLDHGDLCQFLKTHVTAENNSSSSLPYGVKTLSYNCLLYMGAQIASGMRYLESLDFVHRDLATRNCLIGKGYQIKICDFGTHNELYINDYYKLDGNNPLPIRWMAWECIYQDKYTTKSDVWAFAVTLWEILSLCRKQPFDALSDREVMTNLTSMMHGNVVDFMYLPRPSTTSKDIHDLMLECWRPRSDDRPTFREIHIFLQRKNLGYAPA